MAGTTLKLRDYQDRAVTHIFERDRSLILAPVGAGKTAIALTAMKELLAEGVVSRWLVLAPLRVAEHVWPAEAKKWAPELRIEVATGAPDKRLVVVRGDADIVVLNYENLQWLSLQKKLTFDGIVFDELTRLKNPSGQRFKALSRVIEPMKVRIGLTGSFTSNGLEDVFGQCKIVDEQLLGRSKGAFQQQYFYLTNPYTHEWAPRPGALEAVMARIKPATYLLEPGVYTDTLPPLHTVPVPVTMDLGPYERMKENFMLQFPDAAAIAANAAAVTTKLQQLASGFVYDEHQRARWLHMHKLDAVENVYEENQRAPTLVVYNFRADLAKLMERFPFAATLDDANVIERWNRGEVPMLLIHPAAAGHGLNLQQGGCHMIWLSAPWSLELYEQTVGRLHRSGQKRPVWNYVIQTQGTIDQTIWQALRDKRSLSDMAQEALK